MYFFLLSILCFTLLAFLRYRLALYSLIILIPAFLIRSTVIGVPTTFLELGIYILFLVAVIQKRKNLVRYSRQMWRTHKGACIGIHILLISAVCATYFSPYPLVGLGVLKAWFIDPLIFSFLIYEEVSSYKRIDLVFVSLSVSVLWLSVWGIIEKYWGFGLTVGTRLDSVFESPNYFAMYVGPIIAMNIALILAGSRIIKEKTLPLIVPWARAMLLISTLLGIGGLYYAQSFGGWFALGSVIVYLLLHTQYAKVVWGTLILIFAVCIGVYLNNPNSIQEVTHRSNFTGQSSVTIRLQIWNTALVVIRDNPLWGIGPGSFGKAYSHYVYTISRSPWELGVIKAHNVYLNFWAEQGLFGLLSFLFLVIFFYIRKPRLWFGVAMAVILLHGLVDTTYFKNDLSVLFWVVYVGGLSSA